METYVHASLLGFLRSQKEAYWPHHLSMARLVARALRLGRSALIETRDNSKSYCWSYLTPALLWEKTVILVTPSSWAEVLLEKEIPLLLKGLGVNKKVIMGDRLPYNDFQGLLLTTPENWLRDRLFQEKRFPPHIPTIIDPADYLEKWTKEILTHTVSPCHWDQLIEKNLPQKSFIEEIYHTLHQIIFKHPSNPYQCYLLGKEEQEKINQLFQGLNKNQLTGQWGAFYAHWFKENHLKWTILDRSKKEFTLNLSPLEIHQPLSLIWPQQPIVLIGGFLDVLPESREKKPQAAAYRKKMGLGDLTYVKFSPNAQNNFIYLYLFERLPLPNTREFQPQLMKVLLSLCQDNKQDNKNPLDKNPIELINLEGKETENPPQDFIVILVEDIPLKSQVGATLAAEFGSIVQVERIVHLEKTNSNPKRILVTGWQYWHQFHPILPPPQQLIITTLPFPSVENPLVAGRVAYHKRHHQDWFRTYLLPTALQAIQRAVLPLRGTQGRVTLLDNRVHHRSYGKTILTALEPLAKMHQ